MSTLFYRIVAFFLLLLLAPLFALIAFAIKLESIGPAIFKQRRTGRGGKTFIIYKFRTMRVGAEKLQKKYLHLNEADGPVFKIYDDQRYTRVGRFLAHAGLDELPQLVNVALGGMTFVGPRPLPVSEASRVPKYYRKRFEVLPGITSPWVIKGAHRLKFDEWMRLDLDYVKNRSFVIDLKVAILTFLIMLRGVWGSLKRL